MFKHLTISVSLTILTCNVANAQNEKKAHNTKSEDTFKAETYFKYKDYNRALKKYLVQYGSDTNNVEINYNIGVCYLSISDDKSKSIPFFEFVYKSGKKEEDLLLNLGLAYTYSYQFDESIKFFNQYKNTTEDKKNKALADMYIRKCENAKELIKHPVNVSFQNMGNAINTEYPEYFPFVTGDSKTIFFTSAREKNRRRRQSSLGFYTSDILYSSFSNKKWTKAISLGNSVNTVEDEQCVYISPDGKKMIINIDNEDFFGDLFISRSTSKGQFSIPIPFTKPINTKRKELEGCISEDEKTVFIASDRKGGVGASDIYMSRMELNGKWSKPLNLGPNINTELKEAFPVYDEKNSTLYFASEGHMNMGGFDIFRSKYDSTTQQFGKAENIGYPLNTPEDNMQFSLESNHIYGYLSAYRKEGLGDLDIYKVTYMDSLPQEKPIVMEKKIDSIKKVDSVVHIAIKDTIKTPILPIDLKYKVQIGFYKNPIEKDIFKGLQGIYSETFPEGTKYFIGSYPDFASAQNKKDHVFSVGLKDAFIVAFYNQKRVTIDEAKALEK